jgi:tetratricopeptide (TPR) repeat protein
VLDGFDAVAGEVLAIDEDATVDKLDKDIREELAQLTRDKAAEVAGHLVMAGRNLDEDPELAYRHARTAMKMASRLASTREAAGLAAYLTGRYSEALADLRTVRRITGTNDHWAVMADCERGLGRPERALAMATAPEAKTLDKETQIELRMVAAGARLDMEQPEAAVVMLQGADLTPAQLQPYTARLRYAYAEALLAAERPEEAREWFSRAADADTEGSTDAADRVDEMDGISFDEVEDELDAEAAADFDGDENEDEFDADGDEEDGEFEDDVEDDDEEDGEDDGDEEEPGTHAEHASPMKDEPLDEA